MVTGIVAKLVTDVRMAFTYLADYQKVSRGLNHVIKPHAVLRSKMTVKNKNLLYHLKLTRIHDILHPIYLNG